MFITSKVRKKIFQILGFVFLVGSSFLQGDNQGDNSVFLYVDNRVVENILDFGGGLNQYLWPAGQNGGYAQWSDSWKISGNYGTISFTATATNDITVGVSTVDPWTVAPYNSSYATLTGTGHLYEIVIGGWGNTQTAIRKGTQTIPRATSTIGIPKHSDGGLGRFVPINYQIIFYRDSNENSDVIAVYAFYPGENKWVRLIHWSDPDFLTATTRWFSLTNWDNPVFYTNISVSTSTTLPV